MRAFPSSMLLSNILFAYDCKEPYPMSMVSNGYPLLDPATPQWGHAGAVACEQSLPQRARALHRGQLD